MSDEAATKIAIGRRLVPLYIAAFFQSLVLWYSIEKLFMRTIGFNDATIGLMIAVYSAVMLAVETPSGILADRWSRKGVLILASVCLAFSGLIGGLSHGVAIYLVAAISWGIFFACYSGTYDSIVYDTIAEADESSKLFDFLYGRVQLYESIALVVSSLAGGFIAVAFGLRSVYFLSIPLSLIPIVALIKFREPTLHKKQTKKPIQQQINNTFQAILRNPPVLPVVIVLILQVTIVYIIYEFSQLWLLALHTPTEYYGIANAVVISSYGVGGVLVARLRLSRFPLIVGTVTIMLLGCLGFILFRSIVLVVASEFIASFSLVGIGIIFSRLLHDSLSSSIRAGASSATSTLGRFLIIPIALLFGYVSNRLTVFKAGYIVLVLCIIMSLFVLIVAKRNNHKGLESI